jgi:hypothetical protein
MIALAIWIAIAALLIALVSNGAEQDRREFS